MRDATEQPSWPSRAKRTLLHRIHILEWLPRYTRSDVIADLVAGITVGLTMMPQSIAYAGLAGLPAQYGLYTAFIGSFTYVFFGTIKEVSIGPTSLMALLTFSYVEGYPIEFVILLTFIAGCMEFLMGVLKLGFLVDFISPCLTSGFTSASAIIIIVAQLKALLGLKLYTHGTFELLVEVCKHLYKTRLPDAILGGSCIVFLVLMKQLSKIRSNNPAIKKSLWFLSISKNALIVLITSIIGFYLHEYGGGAPFILTGPVPHGLPNFTLPSFTAKIGNETVGVVGMVQSLGSGVVVIPLVAILANVAIAKSFSPDIVDASQEMITLGMANIFGSFVQAMPSCGAFTRSAVASSSGVRTPIQGIYSGSIIILALSFLAPHFYYIPKATLAAVLITAAASLIDFEIYPILWKCNKIDFFITLGTFLIAIIFDVEKSIIIGAGVNAIVLLKKWTRPKIEWEVRKNGKVQEYIYVKPEVGLFYPAADYLLETVKKAHKTNDKLPIAIDCCNILSVDYAAAKTLQSLILTYNTSNMQLVLLNVKPEVFRTLQNIINTENLHLCQSTENICDRSFGVGDVEMPLLNNNAEDNRKMSMYDNV